MKPLIVTLLGIFVFLDICMFVPAPNLALLPFTIAVPELSPWLALPLAVHVHLRSGREPVDTDRHDRGHDGLHL